MQRKGKGMPRRARLDSPGTLHHVIVRGIEKRRIVNDDQDRRVFVKGLGEVSQGTQTPVYAWALMNNHAHLLLRSGPGGLASFMRKLLTRYAVRYNHRHHRHGHLFQNRYKSIVVEEDTYFKELVRYIHLNPLRGNIVSDLKALETYPYSGHSVIMGRCIREWQSVGSVLLLFNDRISRARHLYRKYVESGSNQGSRPDLIGGGLVRSAGGWSAIKALRKGLRLCPTT